MNERQQWFEAQCQEKGICAEDLYVVGDYATNKEGDFLYPMTYEDDVEVMNQIRANDLGVDEGTYAECLARLLKVIVAEERQVYEPICYPRGKTPWAMAQVFRECVCRNEMLSKEVREELRKKPVYGVLEPAMEVDSRRGQFPGLCDETSDNASRVILPEEVEVAKGYRFALKMIDLEAFLEQYAYVRNEGQHGSFQILADLEKCVAREWQQRQTVSSRYAIYMYDDPIPEDEDEVYQNSVYFQFSHFEIEDELDEDYRTIYACYREEYYL